MVEHAPPGQYDHPDRRAGMHVDMLWPLLVCTIGFTIAFAAIVLSRMQAAVMERRIRGLLMAQAERA